MIRALLLAFGQLTDPGSRRVVAIGVLGAIAGFAALAALVWYALFHTALTDVAWIDTTLDVVGGLLVFVVAWLLFPAMVATVSSFLLDDVVDRVEARHYPQLARARRLTMGEELANAASLFAIVVAVNLVALPVYIFAPGINLIVYYTINGYLLGRDYFGLIANRRLGTERARILRRSFPLKPFLAGVIIAFLSTVPLVNLLVPVVASAFMVHIFHGLTRRLPPVG
ncbi:hypothetical protein HL658_10610 [Azospirillum sp. RWY-5-1]|uniref:Cysteine biosynthesis protein n=1 Tax=Azospirillum oleiclasticum TaxID=2735135 RepID=A0ABX2T8C1_9PROT|nr:EI24 domain-containing protein [Azospirillum oleiclasticum]NYZ13005.1 hypothetical protein [Azospirillum oleiclasticum]NYZ20322.1 hypothetical protein [Azospirillum oleiclasticum]